MAKSKYKDDFPERVSKMAKKPMIEKDMAANLGVSVVTFEVYKKKYVKFAKALKKGKEEPDEMVESALFRRAMGYSHEDVHISNYQGEITITNIVKHYPPDPTACIFWLKNRRPDLWRDRHDIEHGGSIGLHPVQEELEKLSDKDLLAIAEMNIDEEKDGSNK